MLKTGLDQMICMNRDKIGCLLRWSHDGHNLQLQCAAERG